MIGLLSTTFGVAVASALMPLISVELFVIGLVLKGPEVPWWALALVIAVGQVAGKMLYYYAARGVVRLPAFLRRRTEAKTKGRWSAWIDRFRETCRKRPLWTGGVLLVSAIASLPPFAAIVFVAGWAKVPLTTFLVTGFVGRFLRFGVLAVAPGALVAWI
ncbi:VTT domain-containing protein [Saccharopolyspora erythraea]|uniref:VTT domain-containing protein n=1 Tax=Saccharopolyspora erythraea TaxID=1836 RepID=UPI001BAC6995|nr:VTT domain-containing protein [Saccharopolyspora erythraea]QUH00936.1 VTT domain-containing protein [Saccharopolyspora erythraea]